MPLTPGTKIGAFEIIGSLGAGGMGEVYRARDAQLDRDVAIKILPATFADDPDRLMRFEREARTLAALNHPNIAQIYGLERSDGVKALVMEFVAGTPLERAMTTPMPTADALTIARQIAEALEFAHERGIIHRDLKPANVMLTDDGAVKVLDFGLAKAIGGPAANSSAGDLMNSPTFTSPAITSVGVILGTAAYMAPEQAKGKAVDRRADIWALGVVLFEMLTGRRLYSGETVTETIAHVITQPPDWAALPAGTSEGLKRLLRRCLEKEPRNRFQSAGDVRIEIEELLNSPPSAASPAAYIGAGAAWQRWVPWTLAAVLLAALAISILRPWGSRSRDEAPVRFDVRLAPGELAYDDNTDGALVVLSADGRTIAYAGNVEGRRQLFVRSLDSLQATPLPGTEGATSHTFSPDGRWIAFFTNWGLKKVAVTGGAPVEIVPATDARGVAWGKQDDLVYTPGTTTGLFRVSANGGEPRQLTEPANNERTHRWPSILPDGKTVLFACQLGTGRYDDGTIEAIRIDEEKPARKVLIKGGTFPRYIASGHLTFMREETLFAVPFDAAALEIKGTPQPVLKGILSHGGTAGGAGNGASQIAFAENGTAAYLPGGIAELPSKIVITDRAGKALYTSPMMGELRAPRFSPDGREVAFEATAGGTQNISVWEPVRGHIRRVTFDQSVSGFPIWSPDGRQIAYFSDRGGKKPNVYVTRSDGAGEPQMLFERDALQIGTSFSPDASQLLVMEQTKTGFDVLVLDVAKKEMKPFIATPAPLEMLAMFSPDGKWVAYQSDESGRSEIYVRPFPGPGGKWQISAGGGQAPLWVKSGRELLYVSGTLAMARIMSVTITPAGGVINHDAPKVVLETSLSRLSNTIHVDISPDGTRFALLKDDETTSASSNTHVTIVLNFFSEVRRALSN